MKLTRKQMVEILEGMVDGRELSLFLIQSPGSEFLVTIAHDEEDDTWAWGVEDSVHDWWYIAEIGEIPALDLLGRESGEMRETYRAFRRAKRAEVKAAKTLLLGATNVTTESVLPDRLAWDLNVSEESPVVKGTWITVDTIMFLVARGWTWDHILAVHPELSKDDIQAAIDYTICVKEQAA